MKKIVIMGIVITALAAAFFFIFTPGEMTKEKMLKAFEENKSAYENVGSYFVDHQDLNPKMIYTQDASSYPEIKDDIKKTLDNGFLYIKVSSDHREIAFGTASATDEDHKIIYSPYDSPKHYENAEVTKYGTWYMKM